MMDKLDRLISQLVDGSLSFEVKVTNSELVQRLMAELEEAKNTAEFERKFRYDMEMRYCYESELNNRLLDFCRQQGVKVPRYYFDRKVKKDE